MTAQSTSAEVLHLFDHCFRCRLRKKTTTKQIRKNPPPPENKKTNNSLINFTCRPFSRIIKFVYVAENLEFLLCRSPNYMTCPKYKICPMVLPYVGQILPFQGIMCLVYVFSMPIVNVTLLSLEISIF